MLYFNPFSEKFHAVEEFQTLNVWQRIATLLLSSAAAIATFPILGLGGVAVFRGLTDRFKVIQGTEPTDQVGSLVALIRSKSVEKGMVNRALNGYNPTQPQRLFIKTDEFINKLLLLNGILTTTTETTIQLDKIENPLHKKMLILCAAIQNHNAAASLKEVEKKLETLLSQETQ